MLEDKARWRSALKILDASIVLRQWLSVVRRFSSIPLHPLAFLHLSAELSVISFNIHARLQLCADATPLHHTRPDPSLGGTFSDEHGALDISKPYGRGAAESGQTLRGLRIQRPGQEKSSTRWIREREETTPGAVDGPDVPTFCSLDFENFENPAINLMQNSHQRIVHPMTSDDKEQRTIRSAMQFVNLTTQIFIADLLSYGSWSHSFFTSPYSWTPTSHDKRKTKSIQPPATAS